MIALCCKLIRILFTVGKKRVAFSTDKMLKDIPHFQGLEESIKKVASFTYLKIGAVDKDLYSWALF